MRSFMARDILSLKDIERHDIMRMLKTAEQMEPIARSPAPERRLAHELLPPQVEES